MVNTNKNKIEESIIETEAIKRQIAEESKKTIKALLEEEVRGYMRNTILNEADGEEDEQAAEYEVENAEGDDKDIETNKDTDTTEDAEETVDDSTEPEVAPEVEIEPQGSNAWDEFEQYRVGDEEYDFTKMGSDELIRVYKLMNDDDQITYKKEGNTVEIVDNETGAEYVIKTGSDEENVETKPIETPTTELGDDEEETMFEIDLSKLKRKSLMESLGYTNDYQTKTAMTTPPMNEPTGSGNDWSTGAPKGTEKPFAGDANGEPFEEIVTEEELAAIENDGEEIIDEIVTVTGNNARKATKTMTSQTRENNLPKGSRVVSVGGEYKGTVSETIMKKVKSILKENEELKKALMVVKTGLQEAALVNVNLGQMVKLITENTTSKSEKDEIVKRFCNEAKTIEDSKKLYESIRCDLNKKSTPSLVIEQQFTTGKTIAESVSYSPNSETSHALDLMTRMCR